MIPDYVNLWLRKHRPQRVVPHVTCVDGLTMSVQASSTHYCFPRVGGDLYNYADSYAETYTEVEIGFPSQPIPQLRGYRDDGLEFPDVYGFVPVEIVNQIIHDHGGLDSPLTQALSRLDDDHHTDR